MRRLKYRGRWVMKKDNLPEFTVSVPSQGKVFLCRSDEPLFAAMRRVGFFKGGCCGGGCGICKVRIISGEVFLGAMSREHVTPEEEADGYILACRARLKSDAILEICG